MKPNLTRFHRWLRPAALCTLIAAGPIARAADSDDGFVSLFNGRNLDGWFQGPDNSWVVEDGVITLKRTFDGKEHNNDYLWAKEPSGDFIVELEFKVPAQANSGIYLRTGDIRDPVYTGIEVQVANSYGQTNLSRTGTAGAIYDCQAPSKHAIKAPGEWNRYRITCRGSRIQVQLNDQTVNDLDLDRWVEPKKNPDGSANKFGTALKDFARRGHFGFQDHGRPVWYRNIRMKKL